MPRLIDADALEEKINEIPKGAICYATVAEARAILDFAVRLKALMYQAPTVTPESGWVSVKEKLPEITVGHPDYRGYLVYAHGQVFVADYTIGRYYEAYDWFYVDGEYEPEVTHWMPLPEPPKEDMP